MKNKDEYYTDRYASPELQEKAERFIKELREQYTKDPESINSRPDNMLCHYLLSLKETPPVTKIRLVNIKDATAEYSRKSPDL